MVKQREGKLLGSPFTFLPSAKSCDDAAKRSLSPDCHVHFETVNLKSSRFLPRLRLILYVHVCC